MASRPRCATLRFPSSRFCTSNLPYPCIDGKRRSRSSQLCRGSVALNNVTNSPLGFERNPTAPISTRVGDHRGSVTENQERSVQLPLHFEEIKTHVNCGMHDLIPQRGGSFPRVSCLHPTCSSERVWAYLYPGVQGHPTTLVLRSSQRLDGRSC